ncbi:MAG: hypothetical protein RLZZ618_889 [Pseudomonadota bacterium]|jgi:hypothetical protein
MRAVYGRSPNAAGMHTVQPLAVSAKAVAQSAMRRSQNRQLMRGGRA